MSTHETTTPEAKAEKEPRVSTQSVLDVESSFPRDATEEELQQLPRIVDRIPLAAWAAALVGATERFSYYAVLAVWQNYMQHERGFGAVPGALGLGQATATSISNSFFVFSFLTPMLFAIISDVWLGRYKTLVVALCLLICGNTIMFATSLPIALEKGAGIPGLALSMVFIALGIGGIKSTMSPFIGDQYPQQKPRVFIYNAFYWFTNIASLSAIPATFLEREFDFWVAYLMAAASLLISLAILLSLKSRLVKATPHTGVLPKALRALRIAALHNFRLSAALPASHLQRTGHLPPWDAAFIAELQTGLAACRVIFSFAFFYLCITQVYNNLVSQASTMALHGIPNDMIQAMAAVGCVVFGPVIQGLYTLLARKRIHFGPMARIAVAFVIAAGGMGYAAGLQRVIYSSGPCFDAPGRCPAGEGRPNEVNVWLQTPVYGAMAVAEIFGLVTASEYSYEKAPKGMRGVVQAVVQLSACVGALMGMAISPAARDPWLVAVYAALAGVMVVCAGAFWAVFRKYNR